MIRKAAEFAAKIHENATRKGSNVPYIVHPREVAAITAAITGDPEIIAAAYLHDVIEDAGVGYEELCGEFGKRVADMVLEESEDKTRTWIQRKQDTIDRMKTAPAESLILAFSDKLSNLRSTASDYLIYGDEIWQKFNQKDKKMHEWYYREIFKYFDRFSEYPFYREYEMLLEMVFGHEPDRDRRTDTRGDGI